jgi:aflatoxin B1 aldehyde reductase
LRSYNGLHPQCFQVASKAHPKFSLAHDSLLAQAETSLAELGLDYIDLFYLHSVDEEVPLEETLRAVDRLHREGKILEFGLSNFSGWQTVQVYYMCKELGFCVPTVYQGNYNPLARQAEKSLFPALRMLGIRFYAYSPLAGGLLVSASKLSDTATRAMVWCWAVHG